MLEETFAEPSLFGCGFDIFKALTGLVLPLDQLANAIERGTLRLLLVSLCRAWFPQLINRYKLFFVHHD